MTVLNIWRITFSTVMIPDKTERPKTMHHTDRAEMKRQPNKTLCNAKLNNNNKKIEIRDMNCNTS